jgi:uncharacterized protein
MTYHVRTVGHTLALDRAGSGRRYDSDGRLHVKTSNISKSNVCGYLAEEIPDWQSLGLQRGRIYQLLRPPEELAKAASTFDNIPILSEHVAIDVRDHRPDLVVGSTGTDAKFVAPYLTQSLVIWTAAAITGIESGKRREISCAYKYRAIMDGGTFEGVRYEGRMVDLTGNHLAIIPEGRVGPDVIVADSALPRISSFAERFPQTMRIKISA